MVKQVTVLLNHVFYIVSFMITSSETLNPNLLPLYRKISGAERCKTKTF